jgi:hypothetical protein
MLIRMATRGSTRLPIAGRPALSRVKSARNAARIPRFAKSETRNAGAWSSHSVRARHDVISITQAFMFRGGA